MRKLKVQSTVCFRSLDLLFAPLVSVHSGAGGFSEAGGSSEVTSDKTWCLQAWRQAGFMPLDKQAVAERAL